MNIKFEIGSFIVHPSHGVGRFMGIENVDMDGYVSRFLIIQFDKEKMTVRIPENKVETAGLRDLYTTECIAEILELLKSPTGRVKKIVWGRRAQEYEIKINSGNPSSIVEVLRELHNRNVLSDQSYSERQIYQNALYRFSREYAISYGISEEEAIRDIEKRLNNAA
jgi:CarD family transcriptional regulator